MKSTPRNADLHAVELRWSEEPASRAVTATCWFEREPLWHMLTKHVCGSEPWSRILNGTLLQRLTREVAAGRRLSPSDIEELVESLAVQLKAACGKPLLCRSQEVPLPALGSAIPPGLTPNYFERTDKILILLSSGAVAFLRFVASPFEENLSMVFLTAFFPRQATWVVPARATAASASRYIQRWATFEHTTGGRLLPEPGDRLDEVDDATGSVVQRRLIRFITPENWGFRRLADGEWVWLGPV